MNLLTLQQYDHWIFDWSGTLVDDLTMVLDATNYVLHHYGKEPMEREEFKNRFRLPYEGFYQELLPDVSLEELEDHFRAGFAASEASGVSSPLLPHAREFLEFLKQHGKRMFILSSMDALAFDAHSRELGVHSYFEACYAGVLDKRDQIEVLLKTHGLDPKRTVFLGDMCHDVETARHGGVTSVALLTGYQNEAQLSVANPDVIAPHLAEIQTHLISSL